MSGCDLGLDNAKGESGLDVTIFEWNFISGNKSGNSILKAFSVSRIHNTERTAYGKLYNRS